MPSSGWQTHLEKRFWELSKDDACVKSFAKMCIIFINPFIKYFAEFYVHSRRISLDKNLYCDVVAGLKNDLLMRLVHS